MTSRHVENSGHRLSEEPHEKSENRGEDVSHVNTASVALASAVAKQKPKLFGKNMLQLYAIMGIGYLISSMNGFDGSLMGSLNAMKPYQETFGLDGAGSATGVVFIIYNLGQIGAFPFCGPIADNYGRRVCVFVGCLIVLVGTAIQAASNGMGQFIAGRFLLGFGAAIASAAAPAYAVELAHPAFRGFQAGMYNNFWWLGNILAGWVTYGTNKHLDDSWAWRVPTIVQAALPSVTMTLILFFPESPRWLIMQDRADEALAIFAKYHGDGDPDSPIPQLEFNEVLEVHEACRDPNPWWDYRPLVNTRGARYRLGMVIAMAFIGQWSGNNVVSYFMPEMVKQAGITNPNNQLLINAINPIFSMLGSIYGASLLDKLGRRKMMLWSLCGCIFFYSLLTAFTAQTPHHPTLAYGVIVAIYLFGICFGWGFTPLQALLAVEVLENRTRAKGQGLSYCFLNIAMVVNTYGISVAMDSIGWKLYLVYIGWMFVEMAIIFFFFAETAGKTLEELKVVFDAPNPVKESLKKVKVDIDDTGHILGVEGEPEKV